MAEYELGVDDTELLVEACRMADLVDRLYRESEAGPMLVGDKLNPLLVELRQARQQYRLMLAQLALPELDEDGGPVGAGEPVTDQVGAARSRRAKRAADIRWEREIRSRREGR